MSFNWSDLYVGGPIRPVLTRQPHNDRPTNRTAGHPGWTCNKTRQSKNGRRTPGCSEGQRHGARLVRCRNGRRLDSRCSSEPKCRQILKHISGGGLSQTDEKHTCSPLNQQTCQKSISSAWPMTRCFVLMSFCCKAPEMVGWSLYSSNLRISYNI